MKIPESISAMVYSMKHPALWTLMVWAIAAVGYWLMCRDGDGYVPIAFLYLACIAFVGCMPLIKGEHNTLHWICGITGCAASQVWCVLMAITKPLPPVGIWVTAWALFGIIMLCARLRHWCFWLEVWCMIMVVIYSIIIV